MTRTIYGSIEDILESNYKAYTRKKSKYINLSCSFDIETSSFYIDGEKNACMYAFVIGINGKCYIGRTWDDFRHAIDVLHNFYRTSAENLLTIYVHNLSYEFEFIRNMFTWERIFALAPREVVEAITDTGVRFCCSYILTGYSLAKVGEHLTKYKVEKKVGDLDYSLIRHSETPLNEKELGYIVNDGLVVMAHIQEQIEQLGNITRIPLTKTGYVRRFCKKECLRNDEDNTEKGNMFHKHAKRRNLFYKYYNSMCNLPISSLEEYTRLKEAFQGGFTHANPFWATKQLENVTSWDFTSSYPTQMIAQEYPIGAGEHIVIDSLDLFKRSLKYYCCVFEVTFHNIEATFLYDNPISLSKCRDLKNPLVNNGRVVEADELTTTLTNIDFKILQKTYRWDSITIKDFWRYRKGYLPTPFIRSVLQLYQKKTTLKGVEGMEVEYLSAKENLNSCYGMCVTDILRPTIEIDETSKEWVSKEPNYQEELEKYNTSRGRFICYQWGVFITAYARYALWSGIVSCGADYVYADTDSIKILNSDKHKDYIERYNKYIKERLIKACEYHELSTELVHPKTKDGVEKWLGVWDFDGYYTRFKTLGAKRYMVEYENHKHSLTVSGLNKKTAIPYMEEQSKKKNVDVFALFNENLVVPDEHSGRKVHTYIDFETQGVITDYLGVKSTFHELSSIHIENSSYSLSLADNYVRYLHSIMIKEKYEA